MPVIYHKNVMYGGGSGGGGASAISDLTDVELTNLADGQILKYDATNAVWVNSDETGSGSEKCLFWDFTQSSLDMNQFNPASFQSAVMESNGVRFTGADGYIQFNSYLLRKNMTYEVQIVSMDITDTSRHNDLFRYQNLSSTQNAGLIYRYQSLKWAVWDSVNGWQESGITDKNYFDNCILKVKILSDGKWEIYKDGVLVFAPPAALPFEGTSSWGIGGPNANTSVNNMIIGSVKIYHNVV